MYSRKRMNKLDEIINTYEYRSGEIIKGLNPSKIEKRKLTLDKIMALQTFDRYDKMTRSDLSMIIDFLLDYIFTMEETNGYN